MVDKWPSCIMAWLVTLMLMTIFFGGSEGKLVLAWHATVRAELGIQEDHMARKMA